MNIHYLLFICYLTVYLILLFQGCYYFATSVTSYLLTHLSILLIPLAFLLANLTTVGVSLFRKFPTLGALQILLIANLTILGNQVPICSPHYPSVSLFY